MIMSYVSSKISSSLFVPTTFCFLCQDKNNKSSSLSSFLPPSLLLSSSSSSAAATVVVVTSSSSPPITTTTTSTTTTTTAKSSPDETTIIAEEVVTSKMDDDDDDDDDVAEVSLSSEEKEDVPPKQEDTSQSSLLSNDNNNNDNINDDDIDNKHTTTTTTTTMKLRQVSNIASLLCILDCTMLPIITMALPLFGILVGNNNDNNNTHDHDHVHHHHNHHHHHHNSESPTSTSSSIQMEYFCHLMALYFVLPIGLLTGLMNYFLFHKKISILITTGIGLTLIGLANSCHHHDTIIDNHDLLHGLLGDNNHQVVVEFLHMVHDHQGPFHRIINILGCILLLGSNSISSHH